MKQLGLRRFWSTFSIYQGSLWILFFGATPKWAKAAAVSSGQREELRAFRGPGHRGHLGATEHRERRAGPLAEPTRLWHLGAVQFPHGPRERRRVARERVTT